MISFLTILIVLLLIYIAYFLLEKDRKAETEIETLLKSRLNYIERDYRKSQESLFNLKYKEWVGDNEFEIRRTAIKTMNSAMLSDLSKELSIINKNFAFNPKDIKFVGRFIDLIIFDGAADEEPVNIYFVEIIKSPDKSTSTYKQQIAMAVTNGHITFQEINL